MNSFIVIKIMCMDPNTVNKILDIPIHDHLMIDDKNLSDSDGGSSYLIRTIPSINFVNICVMQVIFKLTIM